MLNIEDSLFIIIDIQEKLLNIVVNKGIAKNTEIMVKTCNELGIPIIATEQYPKGLGSTLSEIKEISENTKYFEKTDFSIMRNEKIQSYIKEIKKKQIIVCGIETHICVLQSCSDLIEEGYEVYLLKDCTSSRVEEDYRTGISYMQQIGVNVINNEIALFMLLKSSKHLKFKELQALIK